MNMKNRLLALMLSLFSITSYGQVTEAINFQAQARGNDGKLMDNKTVKTRISILEISPSASPVYVETQTSLTDQIGLYNLLIGKGSAQTGGFQSIDWSIQPKYIRIELDIEDGSGFKLISTFQLATVPYAFYAKTAKQAENYTETDPLFNSSVAKGITQEDTTRWNSNFQYLWNNNANDLFYNAGRVGLGTSTPQSLLSLEVNTTGTSPERTMLLLDNKSTDDGSVAQVKITAGNSGGQTLLQHHSATYLAVPNTSDYGSIISTGAGFYLHAGGSGNLRFLTSGDGTQGYERMRITNDGKIGIGTLSPTNALTVNGIIESTAGGFKFSDGTIQTTASGWSSASNNIYTASRVNIGALDFPTDVPTALQIQGLGTAHSDLVQFSNINAERKWHLSLQNHTDLNFVQTGVSQDRLYLKDNGNIGMGTSLPLHKLDVRGASADDGAIIGIGNSTKDHSLYLFGGRQNDPNPFVAWNSGDPIRFATVDDTQFNGFTERMRINHNGRVGIDIVDPAEKLSVKGVVESTEGGFKFPDGTIQTTYSIPFNGDMGNQPITNLSDPINEKDAATKAYVDLLKTQIKALESILVLNGLTGLQDIDGNNYLVVKIGNQVWMAENLRTTKFSNGDVIPTTTPVNLNISNESSPIYQWVYNGSEELLLKNGRLYTWFTATDSRNVCPTGWHVATDNDWLTLGSSLGDLNVAGGKLKESGNMNWIGANVDATNSSGFTALPSGSRNLDNFDYLGSNTYFWTNGQYDSEIGYHWRLSTNNGELSQSTGHKYQGYSIRCLKD